MINCKLCNSSSAIKIFSNFPGYIENLEFDIFSCKECNTQFIDSSTLDLKIYDIIYSNSNTPYYDRYLSYAQTIIQQKDPLFYLSTQEITYYPVQKLIENLTNKIDILEVGCGYGYLTYALNKKGHKAIGIDVSEAAINFANNNFGPNYSTSKLEDFKSNQKFDLIVATELIEHLAEPTIFLENCIRLLKPNGRILFTTPNKDYFPNESIWKTDMPPVHTFWFSRSSFNYLAHKYNLNLSFINLTNYIAINENKLISYIYSRKSLNQIPEPILTIEGKSNQVYSNIKNSQFTKIKNAIKYSLPFKYFGHIISKIIKMESQSLAVVLQLK